MLARIRKSMEEKDQGFTLIELLVVMIIIGILAAIAIPVFLSQRAKARDTATKADVSTLGKEVATYFVDGTGTLSLTQTGGAGKDILVKDTTTGATYQATIKVSDGTVLASGTGITSSANLSSSSSWCVALNNASGSVGVYKYSATDGLKASATGCS